MYSIHHFSAALTQELPLIIIASFSFPPDVRGLQANYTFLRMQKLVPFRLLS